MSGSRGLSRRAFIVVGMASAGGLLVAVRLKRTSGAGTLVDPPPSSVTSVRTEERSLHAFVEVASSGMVTITAPCPEIGQGVRTALTQLVTEELRVPWDLVTVVQGEANARYGGQVVGGSDSVRDYWNPLRRAGAIARDLLRQAAANRWGVTIEETFAERGEVIWSDGAVRASYGELAEEAARTTLEPTPRLTRPEEFRLIGRSPSGVDLVEIVTGSARYGLDVRVDDMYYACVARPPHLGSVAERWDADDALQVEGVRHVLELDPVVPGGDLYAAVRGGVAVVADRTWSALAGRDALAITWTATDSIRETSAAIRTRLSEAVERDSPIVIREHGSVSAELAEGSTVLERRFHLPPLAHVCMEPVNGTAHARPDRCDLWGPVQNPQRLRDAVGRALSLSASMVHVYPTLAGGGFGRRLSVDYGVEAALISREVGAPVQVVWTREDDLRFDYYRPPTSHALRAKLTRDGDITAWEHVIASPSLARSIELESREHPGLYDVQGAADLPLDVPHLRISYVPVDVSIRLGSWRSVAHSFNTFVVNCFIDELAEAAGRDPYETHVRLLGRPRAEVLSLPFPGRRGRPRPDVGRILRVLALVVERAGWDTPLPRGWGRGLAWAEYKGSYAAHVAEVSTSGEGHRVERVVAVLDCGRVINPSLTRAQMEGAIIDAVSTVLYWGVDIQAGTITQRNFDTYPLARLYDAPLIESYLVDSELPPT